MRKDRIDKWKGRGLLIIDEKKHKEYVNNWTLVVAFLTIGTLVVGMFAGYDYANNANNANNAAVDCPVFELPGSVYPMSEDCYINIDDIDCMTREEALGGG